MNDDFDPRRPRWTRIALTLLAATSVNSAVAWEADVHYGLTKWLALQVGFAEDQAQSIADGDQDVDKSKLTGPEIATVLSSCIAQDRSGSNSVHEHHFPSEASPPAKPADRVVTAGHVWHGGNEALIPRVTPKNPGGLADVGSYLHALQDSWAHQGEPDVPELCRFRDYGWGHAIKRGGWTCHLADLSYRWEEKDVPQMAEATYRVLQKTLGRTPKHTWPKLQKQVAEFAKAKSKKEKAEWFKARGIHTTDFLEGVSLPDCEQGAPASCRFSDYGYSLDRWFKLSSAKLARLVPPEVIAFLDSSLELISTGSTPSLRERVDMGLAQAALARSLHVDENCPSLLEVNLEFAAGAPFLEGTGGQQPLQVCELAMKLQAGGTIDCATATDQARAALLSTSRRGPGLRFIMDRYKGKFPAFVYSASEDKERGQYLAVAQFAHLPADTLALTVKRIAGKLKITGLHWMTNE